MLNQLMKMGAVMPYLSVRSYRNSMALSTPFLWILQYAHFNIAALLHYHYSIYQQFCQVIIKYSTKNGKVLLIITNISQPYRVREGQEMIRHLHIADAGSISLLWLFKSFHHQYIRKPLVSPLKQSSPVYPKTVQLKMKALIEKCTLFLKYPRNGINIRKMAVLFVV